LGVSESELSRRVKFEPATRTFRVHLEKVRISDLAILAGLPVRQLEIDDTLVSDLGPLAGMPIEILNIGRSRVIDLTPLSACDTLKQLSLYGTSVSDLGPLAGLQLKYLHLGSTKVADLSPLSGMPLERLTADRCPVTNVSPLLQCPTLQMLCLDRTAPGLEKLRTLPALAYVDDQWDTALGRPARTAAEYWAAFDEDSVISK
jgi:Leucine-rich repeat (LRR) protein